MPILTPEMEAYWKMVDRRRPAPRGRRTGTIISTSIDSDRTIHQEFVSCCHCSRIWRWQRNSGRLRGWCGRCMGITCGPGCPMGQSCIPREKVIEMLEAGHQWNNIKHVADRQAVSVRVPDKVPKSRGGVLLGRA